MNNQNTSSIPIRADKTISWLTESRDQWKHKCLRAKLQLKRQTLALKRSRDGRLQLKCLVKSLREQNRKLELMVKAQQDQLSELKKKQ
jgi:hypothetical protein